MYVCMYVHTYTCIFAIFNCYHHRGNKPFRLNWRYRYRPLAYHLFRRRSGLLRRNLPPLLPDSTNLRCKFSSLCDGGGEQVPGTELDTDHISTSHRLIIKSVIRFLFDDYFRFGVFL